jgi:hypothetical protein
MMKPFNLSSNKLLTKKRTIDSKDLTPRIIPKSPVKSTLDEEVISLSNRIERSCVISKRSDKSRSKSPIKLCFTNNQDQITNNNIKNILNDNFVPTTSIRKQFIDKTQEVQPFKAKPLNSKMFKKKVEIKNFEDIFEKTRLETQQFEKTQKVIKKGDKIANIKKNKFDKENICQNIDLMLIEK